jgi:cyanophycinase-like exopeptidase
VQKLMSASAVYIQAGDQARDLALWTGQGSKVRGALQDLIDGEGTIDGKKTTLGGKSAGLAIVGNVVYAGPVNERGVGYSESLSDPFDPRITFVRKFVDIPRLKNVVTDTHFSERHRWARMMAFLARMKQPVPPTFGGADRVEILNPIRTVARGLGVDENTAVILPLDCDATVVGTGAAYFFTAAKAPEVCAPPKRNQQGELEDVPLTYKTVKTYKISGTAYGNKFIFDASDKHYWKGSEGDDVSMVVNNGVLSINGRPLLPYAP